MLTSSPSVITPTTPWQVTVGDLLKVSGVMTMTWGRIDPVATVDLSTPSHDLVCHRVPRHEDTLSIPGHACDHSTEGML